MFAKFIVKGLAIVMACMAITACGVNNETATADNRSISEIAEDYLADKGVAWDLMKIDTYTENGEEYMTISATSNGKLTYYGSVDVSYAAQ